MPGKLQGFKLSEPLGFGWTRLLAATAYVEFFYTLKRHIAQVPGSFDHTKTEVIPSEGRCATAV